MTIALLRDLFDHMEWADARAWTAVFAHDAGRSDGALREVLMHLHAVQRGFLAAWTGQPFTFRENYADTALEREYPAVRAYYGEARRFLDSVTDTRLVEVMTLPWTHWAEQAIGRPPGPTTLGETILQVFMHSTHHRAQVNARLRAVGGAPPLIDYIAWLWLERPAPEWAVAADL